jgi:hypothetical protein
MSFILIGDIHCKEKQPFKNASIDFLNWILQNFKNDIIIQGGDFFDSSSHHHKYIDEILQILSQFKDFRIINGNHDQSQRLGSILLPFRQHKNITIYDEVSEINVDGINILILPYRHNYKEYESIEIEDYKFDYSISHITPIQEQFSNEGIELKFKVNVAHLYNHIHRYREFIDNYGNASLITGSIMDTRYGEQDWEKNIYRIHKNNYEKINVPFFFTHETLNYGDIPTNKTNILNIINAPSKKLVYEMYKDYFIRDNGIELLRTEITKDDYKQQFEKSNILQKFQQYAQDKGLSQEVLECCSQRLSKIV